MAETTEVLVPISMGDLTETDYEILLDAMPSLTEVAPTIAVEPEKPVIAAETKPKSKRVCSKCGHHDGNSVGKIKLGQIVKVEQDGMKLLKIEPICNGCAEKLPPEEKIDKIGRLVSVVGVENREIRILAAAMTYWTAFKAGTAEPLQARRNGNGRVLCGVSGCRFCRDDSAMVARYVIVKNAEGKREIAGICREQFAILIKAEALRSIRLFDFRGAVMEIERRDKKDAAETPKQHEPPALIVVEAKSVPAKPKLSRAEREARRNARRAQLAAEQARDKQAMMDRGVRYVFGDDSNRHKGGKDKSKGGKNKRR